ncbi:hypothetical protein [Paenibacillus terrigena]
MNKICILFNCRIEDIVEHVKEEHGQRT